MDNAIRFQTFDGGEQRFLHVDVAGRTLKLCQIIEQKGKAISWEPLFPEQRIPSYRAFDWHPSIASLVAIGQSSGEASLVHLGEKQDVFSFQAGKPRLCNAVALSSAGHLAVGLDKVRTDFCLNIWDIQQRLNTATTTTPSPSSSKPNTEPLHKLASSEPISSLKFFKQQPKLIVAGMKGQFIRIFDLRDPSAMNGVQFATRCVNNVTIDANDENYFASCFPSGEPEIAIWDRRMPRRWEINGTISENRQPECSLHIKRAISQPGQIWSLRFSRTQRGCLGVLSSTGQLKTFSIITDFVSSTIRSEYARKTGTEWEESLAQPLFLDRTLEVQSPRSGQDSDTPDASRVISFDFMPMNHQSDRTQLLCLMGDQTIQAVAPNFNTTPILASHFETEREGTAIQDAEVIPPKEEAVKVSSTFTQHLQYLEDQGLDHDSKYLQPQSRNYTARTRAKSGYLLNPERNSVVVSENKWLQAFWKWAIWSSSISRDQGMVQDKLDLSHLGVHGLWMEEIDFRTREVGAPSGKGSIRMQPGPRIQSLVDRLRIDCGNITEATEYPYHRKLCLYVMGMVRTTKQCETKVRKSIKKGEHVYAAALALFDNRRELAYEALRGTGTGKDHQMLAMAIAGLPKGVYDSQDASVMTSEWSDTLRSIYTEETDPYARAILAYVQGGSWGAVGDEASIPLKHRLLVAVKWYNDSDLSRYIQRMTREAIHNGDIEGLLLTGLGTSMTLELMQNYISRFRDLQTAVLAASVDGCAMKYNHTNKRIMRKYAGWRLDYASMLQNWGLKFDRVRFEIGVAKVAVDIDGQKLIQPPGPQIRLVCGHCQGSLARFERGETSDGEKGSNAQRNLSLPSPRDLKMNPVSAAATGTVCPKCGHHLPRCGVCNLWLGVPDPSYNRWYKTEEDKDEMIGKIKGSKSSFGGVIEPQTDEEIKRDEWDARMGHFTVFCTKCSHGYHASHARDWFQGYSGRPGHRVCPVVDCSCLCGL